MFEAVAIEIKLLQGLGPRPVALLGLVVSRFRRLEGAKPCGLLEPRLTTGRASRTRQGSS